MSLLDRIRPDVEAAPWVIEEIRKLEAQLAERERQLEAARRAWNLHREDLQMVSSLCFEFHDPDDSNKELAQLLKSILHSMISASSISSALSTPPPPAADEKEGDK